MRVVAIVQARTGSTRLPRKVLAGIAGAPMLARVIERVRLADFVDEVVVATTTQPDDDEVVVVAEQLGVAVFRGSCDDVLSRYAGAARAHRADLVVRVTADCPLLDPSVIDDVIVALGPDVDYASNTHTRSFPRGLDVEALHYDTLVRIARMATSAPAREHVTAFVLEQPALFRVRQVRADHNDSDLRWTVDTADDLATVRQIYGELDLANDVAPYARVVAAVRARPTLATRNQHVMQKHWSEPRGE